jgi:hypothetical protein
MICHLAQFNKPTTMYNYPLFSKFTLFFWPHYFVKHYLSSDNLNKNFTDVNTKNIFHHTKIICYN